MNPASLQAYLIGVLSADLGIRGATSGEFERLCAAQEWAWAGQQNLSSGVSGDTAACQRLTEKVRTDVSVAAAAAFEWLVEKQSAAAAALGVTAVSAEMGRLYGELLESVTRHLSALPDKPEETPESTLRALWLLAAGMPMSAEPAAGAPLPNLDADAVARLQRLLEQRRQGTPLAHLTGRQQFMGVELHVGKAALVPRKETEILGYCALGVLRRLAQDGPKPLVIDVCTGVGNVAMALASYEPAARVYASDLSDEAVALARENSNRLALGGRLEFRQGDFLTPFDNEQFWGHVDVLTCNPPYISSGKLGSMPEEIIGHEPRLAFDGGPFGVRILQRLISEVPRYVRPGGWLIFEVGDGQGPAILDRLRRNPAYRNSRGVPDASGTVRTIVAQLSGTVAS